MRFAITFAALAATGLFAASATAADPVKMETGMTGAVEVPGPGAPAAEGMAMLTVDPAKNQVCYMLHAKGTDTPTMAHIHQGAAGIAGPVVVMLAPPANGMSQGCADAKPEVIAAILAKPSDYYVNVHTAAYPKGAMRGQLGGK